jgi:hypothetical protein
VDYLENYHLKDEPEEKDQQKVKLLVFFFVVEVFALT